MKNQNIQLESQINEINMLKTEKTRLEIVLKKTKTKNNHEIEMLKKQKIQLECQLREFEMTKTREIHEIERL